MKDASRSLRTPCQLSSTTHKNLNDYALSAAAAGVAILSLHPPAAAEVVYTPTDQRIAFGRKLALDVNNDGVVDFELVNFLHLSTTPFGDDLSIRPAAAGNGVWGSRPKAFYYAAAALPAGVQVGPGGAFLDRAAGMAYASQTGFTFVSGGQWKDATNRYLGLKFVINGELHYGWARLTVHADKMKEQVTATLTGYAYETVANQAILTGQTQSGSIRSRTDSPAASRLGLLALGFRGLAAWRREDSL
jgi:hypothetical protein